MSHSDDKKLQALIDDLEKSVATFDERFSAFTEDPVAAPVISARAAKGFPTIDLNANAREIQVPQKKASEASLPAPETDLLSELATAAEQRLAQNKQSSSQKHLATEAIGRALRGADNFLQKLVAHVNVLQPEIPLTYAIDRKHHFTQLRWHEASSGYRTENMTEQAHITNLTLRIRYVAPPVTVAVPEALLERFEKELALINLAWAEKALVTIPGHGPGRQIEISGNIPVQVAFAADVDAGQIIMRCRNLLGLGLCAFSIRPEQLDNAVLDALSRCLIGRSKHIPPAFKPVVAFDKQRTSR